MSKIDILLSVLDHIENNLTYELDAKMCADRCGYSLSNLQKLFRRAFHIGVSEYISRRRLTLAARELIDGDESVLDIAVKYGYNSHEVFDRAFFRLFGETPSRFRRERTFSEIFPKLSVAPIDKKGVVIMTKCKFDVSQFYDFIASRRGKYVICFDTESLMRINDEYGRNAGDLVIAECLRRIDEGSDESMAAIRIGGDEYVLITDFAELKDAEECAGKILSENGKTVKSGGTEIAVSMRAGFKRIPEADTIRCDELFNGFIDTVNEAKFR